MEVNGITDNAQGHHFFPSVSVTEESAFTSLDIENSQHSDNYTVSVLLSPERQTNVQPAMKFMDIEEPLELDCSVNSVSVNQASGSTRNFHIVSDEISSAKEPTTVSNETSNEDLFYIQHLEGNIFHSCSIEGDHFQKNQELLELHTSQSQQLQHYVPLQKEESNENSQSMIKILSDARCNDIACDQSVPVDHQYASEYPHISEQQHTKSGELLPTLDMEITDIPKRYEIKVDFVNQTEKAPLMGRKNCALSLNENLHNAKGSTPDNSNLCAQVEGSRLLSDGTDTNLKSSSEKGTVESIKQSSENAKDTRNNIEAAGNNSAENKTRSQNSYRTLVERKTAFDYSGWGKEEKELSSDLVTEHALKCGYCSEIFPDKDTLISHLLSHDSKTLKGKRSHTLKSNKQNNLSQTTHSKDQADSDSPSCSTMIKTNLEKLNTEHCETKVNNVCRKDSDCKFHFKKKVLGQNGYNGETDNSLNAPHEKRECKRRTDSDKCIVDQETCIESVEREIKLTRKGTENCDDISRNVMASVGKRNAKKKLGDDFIMIELTRKKAKEKSTKCKDVPNKSVADKQQPERTFKNIKKDLEGRTKPSLSKHDSETTWHDINSQKKQVNDKSNEKKEVLPKCKIETKYKLKQTPAKTSNDISDTANFSATEQKQKSTKLSSSNINSGKELCTPATVLRCVQCKGCFLWKQPFLDHLKVHPSKTPFECFTCKKTFRTFVNLKLHMKRCNRSDKDLSCQKCDRTFRSKYLLKMHMTWHGETIASHYMCNICNKSFAYKFILSRHMRKEHSVAKHGGAEPYKCIPCGKSFRDSKCLWMHTKRHPNAVKPYKCDICQKRFALHGWLVDHIQRHNPVRKFPCNVCGKKYYTLSDAKMHQRRHSKEASFPCTHCERKFIYKSELNAHIKRHLGVKLPKNIPCKICNKLFFTKRDLERHSMVHSGDKPYECPICSKHFSQEINMQVHVKIHNGDKPYQCNVCEKRFIAKSKLLRHQKCHNTAKGKLPRPFICVLCPRKYTAENSLVRHLRTHKDSSETIASIKDALKRAMEEEEDVSESSKPGAVLAMMIDQAIWDAKKLAKGRKKSREEKPFASLIDQAVHDSKATSSSTQTPIVKMENIDTLDDSVTLSESMDTADEPESDKCFTNSTGTSITSGANSCSDLLQLISDSLGKQAESDLPTQHSTTLRKRHTEMSTPQTIIVSPKGSVINPNSTAVKSNIGQQVHHSVIVPNHIVFPSGQLKSLLAPSSVMQQAPVFQNLQTEQSSNENQQIFIQNLNQNNLDLRVESPIEQEQIIVNNDNPTASSAFSGGDQQAHLPHTMISSPNKRQHIILQSSVPERINKSVQIIIPAKGRSNVRTQPSFSSTSTNPKQNCGKPVQQFFLPQDSGHLSQNEQVVLIPSGSNYMKSNSNSILQQSASPNKMRHIVLKTNGGQTFLIPSPVIALDETSSIVPQSINPAACITDDGAEINMQHFVEKIQTEDYC